jgi:hypothetical protein
MEGAKNGIIPVQTIFSLKEKKQKAISHRWSPIATVAIFQRNVCVLDVGAIPGPILIYHLSDIKSNVDCARGDVLTLKGEYNLSNSLGLSPVQLRTCAPFFGPVLDNAMAARNFE